ncbi:MAG: cation:proton antiporter [Methanomassiliicoccales archaeon]
MIDIWILTLFVSIAVVSAMLSLRLGITVAIIEIVLGMLVGNALGIKGSDHEWLVFLASLGSIVLTFLAGSEIDPDALRRTWKASLSIGLSSFIAPFIGSWAFALLVLGWTPEASLICGVALSTTSVAVVYVVLVETGLGKTETGKIILSACFITDLGTAMALSLLFSAPNLYFLLLIGALVICTLFLPKAMKWLFLRVRGSTGEIEVKSLLLAVLLLGAIAESSGVHAVLPAYILGLLMARLLDENREVLFKMKTVALAFLTPFFFISSGTNVSIAAVVSGIALVAALFLVKVGWKFVGVLPLAHKYIKGNAAYTTLLMSTGLTFGTISAQFGLSSGLITTEQFSVLVMTVLLTAIIPTVIAQRYFSPNKGG